MKTQGLSFENIPALHIPFRFFNTAPWMGVLASIVLICNSDNALISQWSPTLLAVTHLFTLGFLAMVMIGALFQLLPVITGETIPQSNVVATLVHMFLIAGLLCLASGFLWQNYALFYIALPMLLFAFICFLSSLGSLLIRKLHGGESLIAIRLAAISLFLTLTIGALRAVNYLYPSDLLSQANVTYLHMSWGLSGWVLLLVMGVSYQVIPMFHVTPNYSKKFAKLIPITVFLSLLSVSFIRNEWVQQFSIFVLCSTAIIYALYTLRLLSKRKRKLPDITINFWRLALINLIVASLLLLLACFADHWLLSSGFNQQVYILIGNIMIIGFACSVIIGMLQKIIPFLVYLHLQRQCLSNFELLRTLPHSKIIVPDNRSQWQFRLHLLTLILSVIAVLFPAIISFAALVMALDFCWLGYCVASASRLYWQASRRIQYKLFDGMQALDNRT